MNKFGEQTVDLIHKQELNFAKSKYLEILIQKYKEMESTQENLRSNLENRQIYKIRKIKQNKIYFELMETNI